MEGRRLVLPLALSLRMCYSYTPSRVPHSAMGPIGIFNRDIHIVFFTADSFANPIVGLPAVFWRHLVP